MDSCTRGCLGTLGCALVIVGLFCWPVWILAAVFLLIAFLAR